MVSLEPVYISSDEEGTRRKRSKSRKNQGPQPQPRGRAKSVDPRGGQPVEFKKRSSSAPSKISTPWDPIGSSDATAERPRVPCDPKTAQTAQAILNFYPPIEALHFPERYEVAPSNENYTGLDGSTRETDHQPTNLSSAGSKLDDQQSLNPIASPDYVSGRSSTNPNTPNTNPLKRKHDQAPSEPSKRPRATAPTYIPRHLPYYPSNGPVHQASSRGKAPYYTPMSSSSQPQLPTSNQTLWATPAYDPSMDDKSTNLNNPLCTSATKPVVPEASNRGLPATAKSMAATPKTRKKQWSCGIIADLGTELQRTFDAQAFSAKNGVDVREVVKVVSAYVHQPLFAFSTRGVSRVKMREFKEKLKEHDKRMKEAATSSDQNAGGTGRGKGKRVPIVDRIQSQTRKVEVRLEETRPVA